MEQEHRQAIQSNFASLVETTDLDYMLAALYEQGVFSERMIERYKDTRYTSRELKRKLYSDITRRGPEAFQKLLSILNEAGLWNLVRDLDINCEYNLGPRSNVMKPNYKQQSNDDENNFVSIANKKKSLEGHKAGAVLTSTATGSNTNIINSAHNYQNNNDNEDIPAFQVIKSVKFVEDDESKDIKLYKTRGRMRGVLLLFTYQNFLNEEYRSGVEMDTKCLKYLFSEIGFKVLSYKDLDLQATRRTLAGLRAVLSERTESVFAVMSSHGYEARGAADAEVRCSDGGLLPLQEYMAYFSNRSLPRLALVPKVFIFQICRGDIRDYLESGLVDVGGAAFDGTPQPPERLIPPADKRYFSNVLVANSTLPGFVSRRDPKLGSWYIQALCEVFAARAHDCHVDKLFTLVDQRLQERFRVQTSSVDRWGFNRRLYLHPGLFETDPDPHPHT